MGILDMAGGGGYVLEDDAHEQGCDGVSLYGARQYESAGVQL